MKQLYPSSAYEARFDEGNYWQSTTDTPIPPTLKADIVTEVAIIGAGYTGLNAALQLANYGIGATVLDTAWPGWGASGRNGGFVCLGGAKLSDNGIVKDFGLEAAKDFFNAQNASIDLVADVLAEYSIDADVRGAGEYSLAHRPKDFAAMPEEARFFNDIRGTRAEVLSPDALREIGLHSPQFHGGLHVHAGFGINPLKYVLGLSEAAQKRGVKVFANSPALNITREGSGFRIETPKGILRAKKLLFATNGYSRDGMPNALSGWHLPVLSNVLVTRPLTDTEKQDQGWHAQELVADTRNLLHYVRLLPDGRFLFGMRGGTGLSPRDEANMRKRIRRSFEAMFPAWAHVETPNFWSGLACLSRQRAAYVGPLDQGEYAALAYHGSGIAMGSWAGRQIAKVIAGKAAPEAIPALLRQPPKTFPIPRIRRHYLKAAYAWYGLKDR